MQLSLKPKNPSLREYQNGNQKYENFESVRKYLYESVKECQKGSLECWEASPIYRGVSCLENKLGLLKN